MAGVAPVVLPSTEFEDGHLGTEPLADDLRLDLCAADQRPPERELFAAHEEDLIEGHRVADISRHLLDPELVALFDPVLLAARLEHRVHGNSLFRSRTHALITRECGGAFDGARSIGARDPL